MNKLFESNAKVTTIADPYAKIILQEASYIQYEQIRLNDYLASLKFH